VLDSGIRWHPDLAPNALSGYDFVSNPITSMDGDGRDPNPDSGNPVGSCGSLSLHGTKVAGLIGAIANNERGVVGAAHGAHILPVRIGGPCAVGTLSDVAEGLIWAAGGNLPGVPANSHPARVVNMSIGAPGGCPGTLQSAITFAREQGAVVVASAGNESEDAGGHNPANCSGVIAVAAIERDGRKISYSNFGAAVDVAAPGSWLMTTVPGIDGGYSTFTGTSASAPLVSGVAALILAHEPSLTPSEVQLRLTMTARPFPVSCSGCGTGIVNARAATAPVITILAPPASISTPGFVFGGTYTVSFPAAPDATHYTLQRSQNQVSWTTTSYLLNTAKTLSSPPPGNYWHRVRACNNYGCGPWRVGTRMEVCNQECE
jgi:serine protease